MTYALRIWLMPWVLLKAVLPETWTWVRERFIRLAIRFSRLVLPEPLLPIIAVRVPVGIEAVMLDKTVFVLSVGWLWLCSRCFSFHIGSHVGGVVLTLRERLVTVMSVGLTARKERLLAISPASCRCGIGCFTTLNSISSFSMSGVGTLDVE